jgi:hypothetical protein
MNCEEVNRMNRMLRPDASARLAARLNLSSLLLHKDCWTSQSLRVSPAEPGDFLLGINQCRNSTSIYRLQVFGRPGYDA